jgi:protease IV
MASDSFVKDIFKSFFSSLFRVIGIGIGIIILFIALSVMFKKPPAPQHTTTAQIVPNDQWEQKELSTTTPTIVKINIIGVIGMDHLTLSDIKNQLIDTINGEIKQEQVKGILLYIDSPGGTADDSDAIYRLLMEYKKKYKVPIYAYIGGMCASGGTMISCTADKLFGSPPSLVGHVGVMIPPVFNFSTLMDRVGIESKTIIAGKDKDAMNPFRPWKPDEAAELQGIANDYYGQFLTIVSTHRPLLTKESLIEQGAQIYPASQALKLGYIDGIVDSIEDTMKLLATETGIEKEYQVVELQTKNWLEDLFDGNQTLFPHKIEHEIVLPGSLHPKLQGRFCYLYCPEYNSSHVTRGNAKTLSH